MGNRIYFPFSAVIGQDKAKKALLIAAVNPKAGALLLGGAKGCGKSTLVRSMDPFLPGKIHIELPLNVTEDMLFGSMDLEFALNEGKRRFLPGILARAENTFLYIDEVNLLQRDFLTAVLDASNSGFNLVERDGVSVRHLVQYTVVGTMNPEEGLIPQPILDRFGMYAECTPLATAKERVLLMKEILSFEKNPQAFLDNQAAKQALLSLHVQRAREILVQSTVSAAMIELAAQICSKAFCPGHQAELYLLETARAIAALGERNYILPQDMDEAAIFVLPHRMRKPPEQEQPQDNMMPQTDQSSDDDKSSDSNDEQESAAPPPNSPIENNQTDNTDTTNEDKQDNSPENLAPEESVANIDHKFSMPKMLVDLAKDRIIRRGSGKRSVTKTDLKQGRYVRAAVPKGKTNDFAFDATIRAAAPYQKNRHSKACAIVIDQADIREKVREKRIGSTFLFLVDASGSMGARERMKAVKGAIFSMLQEAYEKRDKVGMIAFRRNAAEVLLPITRSVDLAEKCLRQMPTGGKTPLAEGLSAAANLLSQQQRHDKDQQTILVMITDGRTNGDSADNNQPLNNALAEAAKIRELNTAAVVIDTENDFIRLGVAKDLAQQMGATYYSLNRLSKEQVLHIVKNIS